MEQATVIIPVKDEEDGLRFLLDDYKQSSFEGNSFVEFIFVIDGRTSDNSKAIAKEFSHHIIDQKDTHGKGAAVKQAVSVWRSNRTPHVVFLDADGSYSFDAVSDVLRTLEEGADVVSGSRFLNGKGRPKGMSRLHNLGNRVLSVI
jgi:glycosyltransferase involved in cell wall biosynthesis